jgi:hypothetical protein
MTGQLQYMTISIVQHGRDRMVVGFTTTYAIGAYISPLMLWVRLSLRVRCTTLSDKVCH